MLSFRSELKKTDRDIVREIIVSTGFFEGAPDETDIAVELVDTALKDGCDASGYYFLFAEENGVVLAYICFGPIPCTNASFDIYWLAARKTVQRRGIGRQLMQKALRTIREKGGRRVYLQTAGRPQYHPTHLFYQACGFTLESRLKDYYNIGDDCLTFSYEIKKD